MQDWLAKNFPPRPADSHKGTYGTLLSLCGSDGMAGAAILSQRAAMRCGVGLTVCALPRCIYPAVAGAVPETVFAPYESGDAAAALTRWLPKATALLIGCGLGRESDETVRWLLDTAPLPTILDADGINAAARHIPIRKAESAPLLLTPHPAELARLLHCSTGQVQQNRAAAATEAARRWHAVTVLKGHRTLVATADGVVFENPTGNPGMATAGSGDVLAGMIGALLAQGFTATDAAVCGVYLHGAAGDAAAAVLSQQALIASDIIEALPRLFSQLK